jgi:hypothetical protein
MELIFGLPAVQYQLAPFVTAPFSYICKSGTAAPIPAGDAGENTAERHAIHTILEWERRLAKEPGLTKVQLAKTEGLSKPRITQMFTLLKLPKEAQIHLQQLESPVSIKYFSVKRLMAVAELPDARREDEFAKLRESCPSKAA